MPDYLKIHDWDIHQTYRKDRGQPPWIKIHRSLMRNIKWVGLDDAERGQLVAIWLLAADNDGVIPSDSKIIQKFCFMSSAPNINKFIELGFIDKNDVTMASSCCQRGVIVASSGCQDDAPEENREENREETESSGADALKPALNDPIQTFQEFWDVYPRKVGKTNAQNAWMKIKPDNELLAKILTTLAKQKKNKDWLKDSGKYVPHPTTWLNGRRWEDEIEPEHNKSKTEEPFLGIAGLI